MLQHLEQRLLGPVQVLDEECDGTFGGELLEQRRPRVLKAIPRDERVQAPGDVETECEPEDLAAVQPFERSLGRVAVEQAELLLEDLAERPVRDLAVGQAAPRALERLRLAAGKPLPELTHEPGLPQARIAENQLQPRRPLGDDLLVRRPELSELGLAADERRRETADAARPLQRQRPDERAARNPARLSFRLDRRRAAELECAADGGNRPLTRKDLA